MTKTIAIKEVVHLLGVDRFDPMELGVYRRIRSFIDEILEEEPAATLVRESHDRSPKVSDTLSSQRGSQRAR
ncbi:MAG TPA: hypothetical protein VGC99_09460 [Candidatus Tectomicrobia bacterium]|jgi:hypothetical protein